MQSIWPAWYQRKLSTGGGKSTSLYSLVCQSLNLKKSYHRHKEGKGILNTQHRYMFHCAQSDMMQKEHRKHPNPMKHRDTQWMSAFPCRGWLTINIQDISGRMCAMIRITHNVKHIPYEWVDVPQSVQKMIKDNDTNSFKDVSCYICQWQEGSYSYL